MDQMKLFFASSVEWKTCSWEVLLVNTVHIFNVKIFQCNGTEVCHTQIDISELIYLKEHQKSYLKPFTLFCLAWTFCLRNKASCLMENILISSKTCFNHTEVFSSHFQS